MLQMTARRWSAFKRTFVQPPARSSSSWNPCPWNLCPFQLPHLFSRCFHSLAQNDTIWQKHRAGLITNTDSISASAVPYCKQGINLNNCYLDDLQGDPQVRAPLSHSCFQKLEGAPSRKKPKELWVTQFLFHHTFPEDLVCLKYKWMHTGASGFREQ